MIDAHRGAFEYDWRTRFHRSLRVVGRSMSWGEAQRLTRLLARDTASQVGAALSEWQYPVSRNTLALMDLYDATARVHFKKPLPYPRPWDPPPKRIGSASMSIPEIRALLDEQRGVTSLQRDRKGRLHDERGRFVKEPRG